MKYNFDDKIIKPSSNDNIKIESAKEQFEKKIKENREKVDRIEELIITNRELALQRGDKAELIIANKEIAFQSREKADRSAELIIVKKELALQSGEKAKWAIELSIAKKELALQCEENADQAEQLNIANKELASQNREKADRVAELIIANKELALQSGEKAEWAKELSISNKELALQSEENAHQAAQLINTNKELAFQNREKANRAAELIITNKELALQNKELAERAEKLIIANKTQGEYFINISHELKTPLNIICSTVQLFNMHHNSGSLDSRKNSIVKYMDSIKQSSYRLSKLINNIVDLSKIESGFFELHLSNSNIVEVVEEMVMSITNFTDSKGINIIFDTEVEEKIIACDSEKIDRIVLNLISNAIKFSDDDGKIFVEVKDKNEFVEISVKDNGIGIEEKNLGVIFDRFNQVDKSLSRNTEGIGIGLSLVKSIAELHGGSVHVESQVGKGSKFTVMLPAKNIIHENTLYSSKMINKDKTIQIELSDIYM